MERLTLTIKAYRKGDPDEWVGGVETFDMELSVGAHGLFNPDDHHVNFLFAEDERDFWVSTVALHTVLTRILKSQQARIK